MDSNWIPNGTDAQSFELPSTASYFEIGWRNAGILSRNSTPAVVVAAMRVAADIRHIPYHPFKDKKNCLLTPADNDAKIGVVIESRLIGVSYAVILGIKHEGVVTKSFDDPYIRMYEGEDNSSDVVARIQYSGRVELSNQIFPLCLLTKVDGDWSIVPYALPYKKGGYAEGALSQHHYFTVYYD